MFPNGEIFRGVYKNDLRHGNGLSVNRVTGIIYRGEYREGETQGHGLLYCPPGEIIEANFAPGGKIQDGKIKILVSVQNDDSCSTLTESIMKETSKTPRETAVAFTILRMATSMKENS